jgi:hypothetical protein
LAGRTHKSSAFYSEAGTLARELFSSVSGPVSARLGLAPVWLLMMMLLLARSDFSFLNSIISIQLRYCRLDTSSIETRLDTICSQLTVTSIALQDCYRS